MWERARASWTSTSTGLRRSSRASRSWSGMGVGRAREWWCGNNLARSRTRGKFAPHRSVCGAPSAVDGAHVGVAGTVGGSLRSGGVDAADVGGGELHFERVGVLLDVLNPLGP